MGSNGSDGANARLKQVNGHLEKTSEKNERSARGKRRTKGEKVDRFGEIQAQLDKVRDLAQHPAETRGYLRHIQQGKLHVRDRVNLLLDPGSLKEVGSVSGTIKWDEKKSGADKVSSFVPSNNITALGTIAKRPVAVIADDFTIRAGHADGALYPKTLYMEKLALEMRIPIIRLVDGSSGGGSVTLYRKDGMTYIPRIIAMQEIVEQLDQIPSCGAALGPAIGLGAGRVTATHFNVIAEDVGYLFNAGPVVVAKATYEEGLTFSDLGGARLHTSNGTFDNMATNEKDALNQIKQFLSYMPSSAGILPPIIKSDDPSDRVDEHLRRAIPEKEARMYPIRPIIESIFDKGSFFEIGYNWGVSVCLGLARLNGYPVGVIANDCERGSLAGNLDALASQKTAKHLKLCDVFGIPVIQLVDIGGYAIGTYAERSATMRHGVSLAHAYYTTTMPIFSIIIRKCFGVAGGFMTDSREPHALVAWPSGQWGSLPLEGGIEAAHAKDLRKAREEGGEEGAQKLYDRYYAEYKELSNPVRSASGFLVEEIIDPKDTRPVVCAWTRHIYDYVLPRRLDKVRANIIRPSFR